VSFVAIASIMVDYILTACISTVSAVINGTYFVQIGPHAEYAIILGIIWGVACLNILGIRENARVTFTIFVGAAFVFVNLIALGVLHMDAEAPAGWPAARATSSSRIGSNGMVASSRSSTIGVASCVLAYSGIESVMPDGGASCRDGATFVGRTRSLRSPSASSRRWSRRSRCPRRSTSARTRAT
jgi:amino acid transporter